MAELTYEQLILEHDQICMATDRLLAMSDAPPFDDAAIVTALAALAVLVADHLEKEEHVRRSVMADLRRRQPEQADRLEEELSALVADWTAFLDRWADGRFMRDRSGFATDLAVMMPRLRARMRAETELLYAPALRDSVIRLRD